MRYNARWRNRIKERAFKMKPYMGNKPFVFVSYSHKDSDKAYPVAKIAYEKSYSHVPVLDGRGC